MENSLYEGLHNFGKKKGNVAWVPVSFNIIGMEANVKRFFLETVF